MEKLTENTLLGDVLSIAHHAAVNTGPVPYVDKNAIDRLNTVSKEAMLRANFGGQSEAEAQKRFDAIIKNLPEGEDDLQKLSRLNALDSLVLNTVNSATRARQLPGAQVQMEQFLEEQLKTHNADYIQEALDKMVMSFVHTPHPTIYHTPEARRFEARLSKVLEDPAHTQADDSGQLHLTEDGKAKVAALFNEEKETGEAVGGDSSVGFLKKLASGHADITPQNETDVGSETKAEKENYAAIRQQLHNIVVAWNEAVKKVKGAESLTITPEREQNLFQLRTWGQSADADGREKSTAQFLSLVLDCNTVDDQYIGETLDMRQNAREHRDFMSSLIQIQFRNNYYGRYGKDPKAPDAFHTFCDKFMESKLDAYATNAPSGLSKKEDPRPRWDGPKKSIFQQLTSEHRAAFITELLKRGDKLVPNQIKTIVDEHLEGHNQEDYKERVTDHPDVCGAKQRWKAFIKRYAKEIRAAGLEPDPILLQYKQLIRVTIPFNPNDPNSEKVSLRGAWDTVQKLNGWLLDSDGGNFRDTFYRPKGKGSLMDFWNYVTPQEVLSQNFLQSTVKLANGDGDATKVELEQDERATLMDIIRRMYLIKDALSNPNTKNPEKIATRYQIANFEEAADFLIALKLFEEAGLVQIEKGSGKVVDKSKPLLGIMPLLETGKDLQNSKAIFTELLANDSAKSYWKQRGKVEIMLGFSDGAASAGNFGSQWEIYKSSREIIEMFAKEGIQVEFLQGRGRGVDRGGTIEPSYQVNLMPPEMTCWGRYDTTIQSDLPMDLAASRAYGEDYFTKAMLSTMKGYLDGKETRQRLTAMKDMPNKHLIESERSPIEAIIDLIAKGATEVYNKIVSTDDPKGALGLLNALPDNPYRSSRSTARGGKKTYKKFADLRAIPKEYLFNQIDLPAHNVGLRDALQKALNQDPKMVMEAMQHPFARSSLQMVRTGIGHFDPIIARAYGKAVKSEPFVETVIKDLTGLGGVIDRVLKNDQKSSDLPKEPRTDLPLVANALDHVAHAIVVNGLNNGKPAKPNLSLPGDEKWGETLYNALFVNAQEVGHRDLPIMHAIGR